MIRVIGFQKILTLILLAFFTAVFFFYGTYVLAPQIQDSKKQLSVNKGEISQLTEDINKLVEGIKTFESQKQAFERIKEVGFFDPQNRLETRQRLNEMQKESRLLSAKFSINSAVTEPNKLAREAGHKILNTEISFTLDALEDIDIYNFIYLMNYGFPGQILITDLAITKEQDITQPLLRKIGNGDYVPLVKAELKANWRTMVPDTSIEINDEDTQEEY